MTGTCHNMYLAPACVGLVPLTLLMIRHHAARASWAIRVHLQFLSHAPHLTWFNGSTATDLPQYSWAIIWADLGYSGFYYICGNFFRFSLHPAPGSVTLVDQNHFTSKLYPLTKRLTPPIWSIWDHLPTSHLIWCNRRIAISCRWGRS